MPFCTTHTRNISLAALAVAFLLTGCASPGPPKPPTLNLPKAVTDLTAERIANTVVLHWTTPEKNTDKLDVKGPISAEICREAGADASTAKPTCTPVLKFGVHPGPTQFVDTLPAPLAAGPAHLLVYRVRILNAAGRFSALSSPAFTAAGAAPAPIANLHATAVPAGVMVEWQPVPSDTGINVELVRNDLDLAREQAAKAAAKPAPPAPQPTPKKSKRNKPLVSTSSTSSKPNTGPGSNQPSAEVHLSAASDAGTVDRTVHTGDTYTYTAQRVLTVDLDGHHLQLRGEQSSAITLQVRDIFPPAIPSGLAAVPNPASGTNKQPSIDLSWQPDTDADLAGYLVYRSLGSGEFTRLTPTAITAPAYSDITAAPGQRYSYRVTAIDTTGNESKPTAEVQEQLNP